MPEQFEQEYQYDAFISYRHTEPDMAVAQALHQALERFAIPPPIQKTMGIKKMGKVFRDQEELPTSSNLGANIELALAASKWLIVVASPRLLESQWCMREVDYFIELGRRDRILIILVEGEPADSFPPQLRFVDMDGQRVEIEPLAADVRAADIPGMKKKLSREKLRLLAPMFGVSFDDLFQRTRKYNNRRILILVLAAVVLCAGIFGVVSRQIAETKKAQTAAANETVGQLVLNSMRYLNQQQQPEAIRTAGEALTLAKEYQLDETGAATALYNASVVYPYRKPYAKLAHAGAVNEVCFSSDGTRLATLSDGHIVTVWDTGTAEKLYEMSYFPDYGGLGYSTELQDRDGNWYELEEWLYRLAFTGNNELLVYQANEGIISKYGADGESIFQTEIEADWYYPFQEFISFDAAGAVYVASIDRTWFLDTDTGDVLLDYPSKSRYFAALSADKQSLAIVDETLEYTICEADLSLRQGSFDEVAAGSVSGWYGRYGIRYLYDTYFLIADAEDGISVYDAQAGEYYPVPEIEIPDEEDGLVPILFAVGNQGEFFAGYSKTQVALYSFDAETRKVSKINNYSTGLIDNLLLFGLSEKENMSLVFEGVSEAGGNYRMVTDGSLIYQSVEAEIVGLERLWNNEFGYVFSQADEDGETSLRGSIPLAFTCSGTGLTAEVFQQTNNTVTLSNVKTKPSDFERYTPINAFSASAPYFDPVNNLLVHEAYDKEGIYFSISKIEDSGCTETGRVYLPDTAGYDIFNDPTVVYECEYGENYAVITLAPADRDSSISNGAYVLDYENAELRPLGEEEAYLYSIYIPTAKGIVFGGTSVTPTLYDPRRGAVISRGAEIDWFKDPSGEKRTYWGEFLGASYDANIAVTGYLKFEEGSPKAVQFAMIDFETGKWTFTDQVIQGQDACVLTRDGTRLFTLSKGVSLNAFAIDGEQITSLELPETQGAPIAVQAYPDDVMSVLTDTNIVEFFDMHTLQKLCSVWSLTDTVLDVYYNSECGRAVISSKNACVVYDVAKDTAVTGEILFPALNDPILSASVAISDRGDALVFAFLTYTSTKNDGLSSVNEYVFYSAPLLTGEQLLEATKDY